MSINSKQIITRCVEEFESKTQVELVILIRKHCQSYYSYFWFYTLLFVQIFWVSTVLWNDSFSFEVISAESFFLIALSYLLLMKFELIKFLIPKKTKIKNLKNFAAREFQNMGIYNTRLRSGLLILYSRWENECLLLCDKGVKEKLTDKELETFTNEFKDAFTEKNLGESVGSMIRSFGVYWHTKWPNEDDENEIVHSYSGDDE
jgi:putative membrane protein